MVSWNDVACVILKKKGKIKALYQSSWQTYCDTPQGIIQKKSFQVIFMQACRPMIVILQNEPNYGPDFSTLSGIFER